ncbi:hypothetical protein ACVWXL_005760 [Bradyrhizobium sp. GM22.5]
MFLLKKANINAPAERFSPAGICAILLAEPPSRVQANGYSSRSVFAPERKAGLGATIGTLPEWPPSSNLIAARRNTGFDPSYVSTFGAPSI